MERIYRAMVLALIGLTQPLIICLIEPEKMRIYFFSNGQNRKNLHNLKFFSVIFKNVFIIFCFSYVNRFLDMLCNIKSLKNNKIMQNYRGFRLRSTPQILHYFIKTIFAHNIINILYECIYTKHDPPHYFQIRKYVKC